MKITAKQIETQSIISEPMITANNINSIKVDLTHPPISLIAQASLDPAIRYKLRNCNKLYTIDNISYLRIPHIFLSALDFFIDTPITTIVSKIDKISENNKDIRELSNTIYTYTEYDNILNFLSLQPYYHITYLKYNYFLDLNRIIDKKEEVYIPYKGNEDEVSTLYYILYFITAVYSIYNTIKGELK